MTDLPTLPPMPEPDYTRGTKLVPYEELIMHRKALLSKMGYIHDQKDLFSADRVQSYATAYGLLVQQAERDKYDTLRIEVTLDDSDEPIPIEVQGSVQMLKRLQAFNNGCARQIRELRAATPPAAEYVPMTDEEFDSIRYNVKRWMDYASFRAETLLAFRAVEAATVARMRGAA